MEKITNTLWAFENKFYAVFNAPVYIFRERLALHLNWKLEELHAFCVVSDFTANTFIMKLTMFAVEHAISRPETRLCKLFENEQAELMDEFRERIKIRH